MAKKEGISGEEVGAVQAVVMAVHAGRIRAQVREVRRGIRYRRSPGHRDSGGPEERSPGSGDPR